MNATTHKIGHTILWLMEECYEEVVDKIPESHWLSI